METAKAHAIDTALAVLIGPPLVWWIDPETAAGTAALLAIVIAATNLVAATLRALLRRAAR